MRLTCPKCAAQYEVSDKVIPDGGRDVQCANCQTMWFQPSARMLAMPHPAEDPRYDPAPDATEPQGFSDAPQSEWQPGRSIRNLADADRAQDLQDDAIAAEIAKALEENKIVQDNPPEDAPLDKVLPEAATPSRTDRETEEASSDEEDDPDSENEDLLRPAPQPGMMPRRKLDDGLLAILREEAEREAQARRAEGSLLQTQEEMNLEPVAKAAASRVQAKLALLRQTNAVQTAPVPDAPPARETLREAAPLPDDITEEADEDFWPEGTVFPDSEDAEFEPDEAIPEEELSFGGDAFEAVLPAPDFAEDDPEGIPVVAAYAAPLDAKKFAEDDPDYHIGATLGEDEILAPEAATPVMADPVAQDDAPDKAHVSVSYAEDALPVPDADTPDIPPANAREDSVELVHAEPEPPAQHPVDKVNHFSRRDQLPDIEEINSTLRATSDRGRHAAAYDAPQTLARRRSGFRLGFALVMGVAVILAALYLAAQELSTAVPALQVPLAGYVEAVDKARLALDAQLEKLIVWLGGAG